MITWDESGTDFPRELVEVVIEHIIVRAAGRRRRAFEPDRTRVVPRV